MEGNFAVTKRDNPFSLLRPPVSRKCLISYYTFSLPLTQTQTSPLSLSPLPSRARRTPLTPDDEPPRSRLVLHRGRSHSAAQSLRQQSNLTPLPAHLPSLTLSTLPSPIIILLSRIAPAKLVNQLRCL
uniref:Uncharacterized protein n=1 Tax=Kalanchoe fedtschenkoi TaxID=63787 RepID=A0A7N0TKD4_KALFE